MHRQTKALGALEVLLFVKAKTPGLGHKDTYSINLARPINEKTNIKRMNKYKIYKIH